VDGINLSVPEGSLWGFLGPNGAGKTTTIRLLLGLIRPDAGEVTLFGSPLTGPKINLLRRVGSMVETPSVYPHLTGRENLEVIRRLIDGKKTCLDWALSTVGLQKDAHRLVKTYSTGMRQRLGIALALLEKPDLLILDEPTNGLDPSGIREMRELLSRFPSDEGITVFISSHLLSEMEQMATHLAIIQSGKLIFQGSPDRLRESYAQNVKLSTDDGIRAAQLLHQSGWQPVIMDNDQLSIPVKSRNEVARLNSVLVQNGRPVFRLELSQPSIENIFLNLTEKK